MHCADLDIVLRKLVAQIQAFSQRIYETAMVRFYSTIDPNDVVVVRQVTCDGAFHVRPPSIAAATLDEDRNTRQRSPPAKATPILVIIWI